MTTRPNLSLIVACLASLFVGGLHLATANDLEDSDLPVFEDEGGDGYFIAITGYDTSSRAEFDDRDPFKHTASLDVVLQAPDGEDVLCFATKIKAVSAKNEDNDDLKERDRRRSRGNTEFKAALPSEKYEGRRGKPLNIAEAEMPEITLSRPAYEIEELVLEATAVVVEKRESTEIPAEVADRFIDIGNDTSVKVTLMKVDRGKMRVELDLKRPEGDKAAVLDAVYALNDRGRIVGGGKWINELDIFDKDYDCNLEFEFLGDDSIESLRVVLATKYKVVPVRFEVEELFSAEDD